jgi:hypothetical protein
MLRNGSFVALTITYHLIVLAGLFTTDAPGQIAIVTMFILNIAIYQLQPYRQAPKDRRRQ